MRYLLDTNAVIALQNRRQSLVARRILHHKIDDIGVPVIVVHELYFGAFNSERREHNIRTTESLQYQIVEFNRDDARQAAEIRSILASRGTPIGPYDLLIAGQARARGLILVTRNTREFARVPYLRVEDWSRR